MPLFDYQQIRTEADDEDGVPTKAEPRTLAHTFLIVVASAILGALSLALVQSIFYQPLDLDLRCSRHVSAYGRCASVARMCHILNRSQSLRS